MFLIVILWLTVTHSGCLCTLQAPGQGLVQQAFTWESCLQLPALKKEGRVSGSMQCPTALQQVKDH